MELKVLENGLVPVYESGEMKRFVNAREMHGYLEVGKDFSTWIKDRIEKYGFEEGTDFIVCSPNLGSKTGSGGHNAKEYHLTLDAAKEIAMVENNEKGRMVRKYFIEVEKRYSAREKERITVPTTLLEALRLAADIEEKRLALVAENGKLRPKADFYDAVAGSASAIEMALVAKTLNFAGIGRNTLFRLLRKERILMHDNQPYQEYVDRGYFRTIEQKYTTPDGETCISIKTLVFQRGVDFIRRLLLQLGFEPQAEKAA